MRISEMNWDPALLWFRFRSLLALKTFFDGNPWPRCRTRSTMEERQTDMYRGMNEAVGVSTTGTNWGEVGSYLKGEVNI